MRDEKCFEASTAETSGGLNLVHDSISDHSRISVGRISVVLMSTPPGPSK